MESSRTAALLAAAGIAAPVIFVALVVVQGVMQPDYSHVRMPISALAAWPAGWIQNLNFVLFAGLTAAFALGLHRAVRPTRHGWLATAFLLTSSAGVLVAAIFPWIREDGVPVETGAHVLGAVVSFLFASIGLMALARRMKADPEWSDMATYVFVTGIAILVMFVVLGALAIPAGGPLHPVAGLLQRMLVVVWFACLVAVGVRALRLAPRPGTIRVGRPGSLGE